MVRVVLRALVLLALLAGLAAVHGAAAFARATPAHVAQRGSDLTRDEAAAIARAATGGRVLSVERVVVRGRSVYRVKVLTADGLVRVLRVDARTGAVE